MPIPRLREHHGPALFSYGFRPFFLFGALYAGLAILAWVPAFSGEIELTSIFAPRDWHAHEMLFGFVPAIVTGFLLTAIPNWTGTLPIQGPPLIGLFAMWLAGRAAIALSAWIGWAAAAAVDVMFLILVAAAAAREIAAGRNWRNLKVVVIVLLLAVANLAFHLEVHYSGIADVSIRLGVAVVILLISLIGGRIVPSFTRNWLARRGSGRLPHPFGRFDMVVLAASALALACWIAAPDWMASGLALLAAGTLQAFRLARWAGERTLADRLVLVLHVGYAFIPLGFLLVAAAAFGALPQSAGIHAWTAGAIGTMTLAVMTRASLGHTGRMLAASPATQAIYAVVVAGALARICAAAFPEAGTTLLAVGGLAWGLAFLGFAAVYGPILWRPRLGPAAAA